MIFVTCVDSSDVAPRVVEHAIAHARRWDASIHAIHVFQPPVTIYALEAGVATELQDLESAESEAVWGEVMHLFETAEVPWQKVDRHGYPAAEILDYSRQVDADMIVMGTRGRGDLAALFLGSTSHAVIQQAPCDVLVVRPPT